MPVSVTRKQLDMKCKCGSDRIASVSGKTSDSCSVRLGDMSAEGYPPFDMGIGGGDYIRFKYCLNCGTIQGSFPLPTTELEHPDLDWDMLHSACLYAIQQLRVADQKELGDAPMSAIEHRSMAYRKLRDAMKV